MIYTLEEIIEKIKPIAEKYKLKEVYIFGSYSRSEANEESDIDLLINTEGSLIRGLFKLSGFRIDCVESFGKEVDVITTQALQQEDTKEISDILIKHIMTERVKIYDREGLSNIGLYKKAL